MVVVLEGEAGEVLHLGAAGGGGGVMDAPVHPHIRTHRQYEADDEKEKDDRVHG